MNAERYTELKKKAFTKAQLQALQWKSHGLQVKDYEQTIRDLEVKLRRLLLNSARWTPISRNSAMCMRT